MSLILPPWYFAKCSDNLAGVTPAVAGGTNFTAGANNADGTAVSVLSALSHDVHYLQMNIYNVQLSTVDSTALLDVLIDRAGGTSWSEFISDLAVGNSHLSDPAVCNMYCFPIFIPAGASVGVRCRTAHSVAITTGDIMMWASGVPSRPEMWWFGQGVESLGNTAESSSSTAITPGSSGAWGSWTNVGSTTTKRYGCIQLGYNGTDAGMANAGLHFQIGTASTVLPGCPTIQLVTRTSEQASRGFAGPIWCDIPVGTQLQVRATASSTAEVQDVSLYGVY